MKIVTIVGARPQFVKAAAVSNILRKTHREILVHTGQHYDANMSDVFFEELGIPAPDFNLGVGSGGHGKQTGRMLEALEELFTAERPDAVLVYGDTNSTLAGALAASKLLIPVAHVEAGLRSFSKRMPEEQNRIIADHLSKLLFTPTKAADENLFREGIREGVHNVGDVMYDAVKLFAGKNSQETQKNPGIGEPYALCTIHRAENTDDPARLKALVEMINLPAMRMVVSVHPRTQKRMAEFRLRFGGHVTVTEPVGYLEMLRLEQGAERIVTDSGGVQKEAFFFEKPCITLRDETEWVETVEAGWNTLVGADPVRFEAAFLQAKPAGHPPRLFGDGTAGRKISELLNKAGEE